MQKPLPKRRHAVFSLAPGVLLVFKPRGHREALHAHAHTQRLRVLTGALLVETARRQITLGPRSRLYRLAAGRQHATCALRDTWLIAERQ